jgi:hypothetical protein
LPHSAWIFSYTLFGNTNCPIAGNYLKYGAFGKKYSTYDLMTYDVMYCMTGHILADRDHLAPSFLIDNINTNETTYFSSLFDPSFHLGESMEYNSLSQFTFYPTLS